MVSGLPLLLTGVDNHLKLAIADGSDLNLDSNVFIQAGSLVSGTQISTATIPLSCPSGCGQ